MTKTFTAGKIRTMFESLHRVGDELLACMHRSLTTGAQNELELTEILFRFNTDVIGTCAFGIHCNTLQTDRSEFREIGSKMMQFTRFKLFKLYVAMLFRRQARALGFRLVDSSVSTFILRIVREAIEVRRQRPEDGHRHNDFLQIMIDLLDDTEATTTAGTKDSAGGSGALTRLTVEEIAANVFVFFFAGFETSSTVMAYALYELAQNPDIQDKARQEISAVLGKHSGQMTFECVAEMTYLEQIVNGKYNSLEVEMTPLNFNFIIGQKLCANIPPSEHCIVFPSPTTFCPMAPQCRAERTSSFRRWPFIVIPNCFRIRSASIRIAFRTRIAPAFSRTHFCHSARVRAFVLA